VRNFVEIAGTFEIRLQTQNTTRESMTYKVCHGFD